MYCLYTRSDVNVTECRFEPNSFMPHMRYVTVGTICTLQVQCTRIENRVVCRTNKSIPHEYTDIVRRSLSRLQDVSVNGRSPNSRNLKRQAYFPAQRGFVFPPSLNPTRSSYPLYRPYATCTSTPSSSASPLKTDSKPPDLVRIHGNFHHANALSTHLSSLGGIHRYSEWHL